MCKSRPNVRATQRAVSVTLIERVICAGTTHFVPLGKEEPETESLEVYGESIPEDEDDGETIPVRTLNHFAFFNRDTLAFVPFEALLDINTEDSCLSASGSVGPYADEEDDDDSEDAPDESDSEESFVRLSAILESSSHYDSGLHVLDRKIYVKTAFACYWRKYFVAHTILEYTLEDPNTDRADIVRLVNSAEDVGHPDHLLFDRLVRPITEQVFSEDTTTAYIFTVLDTIMEDTDDPAVARQLSRSALIKSLYPDIVAAPPLRVASRSGSKSRGRDKPTPGLKPLRNMEREVLQHRNATVVTPKVAEIAGQLFTQSLSIAGDVPATGGPLPSYTAADACVHSDNPGVIELLSPTTPGFFRTAVLDGDIFSVGDIVLVEIGEDDNKTRAKNAASSHSDNKLAETKWFCKICYFFVRDGQKCFHAQWLEHGSQTILQETAHPGGLFWIMECDDLPLDCIYSHCKVQQWEVNQPEPRDSFFAGMTWDHENSSFTEYSPDHISRALSHCKWWKRCLSCGVQHLKQQENSWSILPGGGFSYQGTQYHIHDFVYLLVKSVGVLGIGQITELHCDQDQRLEHIAVCLYGRYDDKISSNDCAKDDRRLFKTEEHIKVSHDRIAGKLFVAALSDPQEQQDWVWEDHHFYCDLCCPTLSGSSLAPLDPDTFHQCLKCSKEGATKSSHADSLLQKYGPLKGLELFAGAGGLSTGLELAGAVKCHWAVEFSPGAALTYQANHHDCVVYNQCSNLLLKHAIETDEGKASHPLQSLGDHHTLPPLPQPGEVDFIFGGPPCQSFSEMNHHRKMDDIRSTLVCNHISYVEFYKPRFFLLENVKGMVYTKLGGDAGTHGKGGIKMGVVKFILRSLTALGYQVHFKLLQAGQYGAPQRRRRVIFWGARRDVPLPTFPLPTHAFDLEQKQFSPKVTLPTHAILHPPSILENGKPLGWAALPRVSVNAAISDLPPFDWINPCRVLGPTADYQDGVHARHSEGIESYDAIAEHRLKHMQPHKCAGFNEPTVYLQEPKTRYQDYLRGTDGETVSAHYTRRFPAGIVERVCNIPFQKGANYLLLPKELKGNFKGKKCKNGMYGRVDGEGFFPCVMTKGSPGGKCGQILHPTQHRILSVREFARSQGFPDSYEFHSVNTAPLEIAEDQMRQIGNAVPVPLAFALGKELRKVVVNVLTDREEQEHVDRGRSPDL